VHDGTISKISNATGHLVIDNEATDKHIRLRLGEDNADTAVQIRNNSDSSVWGCDALGNVSGSGTLQVVGATTLGSTLNVSGNVGIATSPSAPLHIYKAAAGGDATPMELLRLEQKDEGVDMNAGHGPAITFYVGETGGSDHGGSVAVVREIAGDADSAAAMSFYTAGDDSAPTEKMRITSTGLVGIGTTSPTHKLTVAGTISGSSTLEVVGNTFIGGTLNVTGNADFNGTITCDDSITIDSVTITDTEIGYLDGLTLGTVAASKVVTADASKDFSGHRNISGSGTLQSVGNAFLGGTLNVTGASTFAGNVLPAADNSLDLGSGAKRWANIYTGDLHLKNERGDWTIAEEEDYLCVINNRTGKKYKMGLIPMEDDE
jgi:hypothetical protein